MSGDARQPLSSQIEAESRVISGDYRCTPDISCHYASEAEKTLAARQRLENKAFSRAGTLASVGFTPNMG
jgi:hypothetical protein